jgi:hypothetical protein
LRDLSRKGTLLALQEVTRKRRAAVRALQYDFPKCLGSTDSLKAERNRLLSPPANGDDPE